MKNKLKEITNSNSMKLFYMLCVYFLTVLVSYTIFKLVKFNNCLCVVQVLGVAIPIVLYLLYEQKKKNKKSILAVLGIYLFIILILPFIYNKTFDLTIDGNSYHKTAIAFIKNGWNPIYEKSTDFQKNNDSIVKFDKSTKINIWIEHYPKATWIIAGTIYNMTNNIESGKCITLIFAIMLLIISYNCLQTILSRKWAVVISILVALNPIVLSQLFTYYVDGIMGIMFTIELLLLLMIKPMEKQDKKLWIAMAGICCVFVNLKFTGLLASGVLAAVFYFYWFFKYKKSKNFVNNFLNITKYFVIVFATSIFIVGSCSYVKNTIEHHNPLYPLIGKDKVDIITTMQPKSFTKKNMMEKFVISTFSRTENVGYYSGEPKLKLPIQTYKTEYDCLLTPDVRIGGFGPYFALILITSLVTLIIGIVILLKKEKENLKYIVLPMLSILISMVLLGENWWARYIPQFYLIPIGALVLIVYLSKYINKKVLFYTLTLITIIPMLLNTRLYLKAEKDLIKTFKEINNDINIMKNTKDLKLQLGTEGLYGYYYDLNDNHIKYTVVKSINDKDKRYKFSWRIVVEEK